MSNTERDQWLQKALLHGVKGQVPPSLLSDAIIRSAEEAVLNRDPWLSTSLRHAPDAEEIAPVALSEAIVRAAANMDHSRDPWVLTALEHAPDAEAAAPRWVSNAIFRAAEASARNKTQFKPVINLRGWLSRLSSLAPVLASLMVSVIVVLMWSTPERRSEMEQRVGGQPTSTAESQMPPSSPATPSSPAKAPEMANGDRSSCVTCSKSLSKQAEFVRPEAASASVAAEFTSAPSAAAPALGAVATAKSRPKAGTKAKPGDLAASAPVVVERPIEKLPSYDIAEARAPAARAAMLPPRAVAAEPASPLSAREMCSGRSFLSHAICMDRECEQPRFRNTAECIPILEVKHARENR